MPLENFSLHEVLRRGSSDRDLWAEDSKLAAAMPMAEDEGNVASPQHPRVCSVGTIAADED